MSRSAKHGILIKTGAILEKMASVKTIAFDKKGTLTIGRPEVAELKLYNGVTNSELLQLAASLETGSNHPLAQAIVRAANAKKLKLTKVKNVKEIAGNGLKGNVGKDRIELGRYSHMSEVETVFPAGFSEKSVTSTATLVAKNGELIGVITFKDEIRPETKKT